MKPRTDPHRPSVIDPSEYVFVGAADDHPGDSYMEIRHDILAAHGVETGVSDRYSATNVPFYDAREDGRPNFRCHHCGKHGSNIRYFCFFLHKPTKKVIVVGQICAKKLSLASREELDFQKRAEDFRRMQARRVWVEMHKDEYEYLKAYDEGHQAGGFYSEFLSSLWDQLQRKSFLSDRQLEALHQNMERRQVQQPVDADRHKGEVRRTFDAPTDAQMAFIAKLSQQLHVDVPQPATRLEASEMINDLKARVNALQDPAEQPATDHQIAYINMLMEQKQMALENRREARRQLDEGLTKSQASRWISKLKELPDSRQED